MSVLAIPGAISAVISGLSSPHKKGGHGGDNSALSSISSTCTSTTETSSTYASSASSASGPPSLFGSIMDAADQLLGIQPAAGASASAISTANASKLDPAAMITAARAALQKA